MYDEKNEEKSKEVPEKEQYNEEVGNELSQFSPSWYADTERKRDGVIENSNKGIWLAYASIILGIIAFFTAPVIFGAAAIILGILARRSKEAKAGGIGIAIGLIAMLLGILIYPLL
ncbi:hypothetical protein KP77_23280 [Jeotgalibacillus alimentarius]|uniref:DUF4190 domain-containing protein n=1 Tax=Jeotgalibacillus alimentarius TaxID=135826 RepID=A0A0C2VVW7_9BACL|nr:DUF4190 domain-containing protein [Jeotgalibacillus alimentarius]KIL48541.1 hypothetical protein KP77_23280 [Jeotgalibacillus alimentarius]